jgi:glycosyltransferase involved in cell wall biosynthesis
MVKGGSILMKVIIVLPAYNAAKTVKLVYDDLKVFNYEMILSDNCSSDDTAVIAEQLGMTVIRQKTNTGYGGNQKTLYKEALSRGADIVIMVHPDYQYDPTLVPYLVGFLERNICDYVFGNRIRTRKEALGGGMPLWKYIVNRTTSLAENMIFGTNLGEWHSGFRAYTKKVLETIPFENNTDNYAFDQQFTVQCIYFGFRIGDVPCPPKYFSEASSISFKKSLKYGFDIIITILKFWFTKAGLMKSKLFVITDKENKNK